MQKSSKRKWQKAIVKALREKGFTKKGAAKTAKITIRKSIAKREREDLKEHKFTLKTTIIDGQAVTIKVYPPA